MIPSTLTLRAPQPRPGCYANLSLEAIAEMCDIGETATHRYHLKPSAGGHVFLGVFNPAHARKLHGCHAATRPKQPMEMIG